MRVLVVDDSAQVRTRLAALIASLPGVTAVHEAENSYAAMDVVSSASPDVVVLDFRLSGESGATVAPAVKRARPDAFVIIITNYATEQHRRLCMASGADAFFDKSSDLDLVARLVAERASPSR